MRPKNRSHIKLLTMAKQGNNEKGLEDIKIFFGVSTATN
uniref:Uncharacterized protein n=1 Tax=Rhizophora mucronata TaxID=61149 RepID=A0A2P2PW30_RHIMU